MTFQKEYEKNWSQRIFVVGHGYCDKLEDLPH